MYIPVPCTGLFRYIFYISEKYILSYTKIIKEFDGIKNIYIYNKSNMLNNVIDNLTVTNGL